MIRAPLTDVLTSHVLLANQTTVEAVTITFLMLITGMLLSSVKDVSLDSRWISIFISNNFHVLSILLSKIVASACDNMQFHHCQLNCQSFDRTNETI